jgi:hypothetical protein
MSCLNWRQSDQAQEAREANPQARQPRRAVRLHPALREAGQGSCRRGVYHDRPGLEAAIIDFDPAITLIEMAADPSNTVDLRGSAAAKLLPYWHKEQSLMIKTADHAGTVIHISIAPWAAIPGSDGAPKAIERQPAMDVTANDPELEAHGRSSAPAPEVFNPAGIAERHAPGSEVFEVERGADGLEHAVRVRHDQPPHDDRWETIRDNATGTDIKVRIHG